MSDCIDDFFILILQINQFVFQGLKFEVVPSTFEENLNKASFQFPYQYALQTAKQKTLEVANKLASDEVSMKGTVNNIVGIKENSSSIWLRIMYEVGLSCCP